MDPRVEAFLAIWTGEPAPEPEALAAALAGLLERARAERPGLAFDDAEPVSHLAAHLDRDADPVAAATSVHAGDLALAAACARGDGGALAVFDASILPAAAVALRGMRATDADVDEAMQRVRERLLVGDGERPPRIGEYAGRGELARWVKATAVRTYLNQIRGVRREVPVGDDGVFEAMARPDLDPELAYLKVRYRAELRAAFSDAVAELSDTQKNILRFRHVDGLTVEEIAELQRIHRGTAHRWLAEARERLARRTGALLRTRLSISADEYESLCRLVESQLDWSLATDLAV